MASKEEEEVMLPNKQVILKVYIIRPPWDSDLEIRASVAIRPKAPPGSKAVLVKNLYPVDPYQAILKQKIDVSTFTCFEPGHITSFVEKLTEKFCSENYASLIRLVNLFELVELLASWLVVRVFANADDFA